MYAQQRKPCPADTTRVCWGVDVGEDVTFINGTAAGGAGALSPPSHHASPSFTLRHAVAPGHAGGAVYSSELAGGIAIKWWGRPRAGLHARPPGNFTPSCHRIGPLLAADRTSQAPCSGEAETEKQMEGRLSGGRNSDRTNPDQTRPDQLCPPVSRPKRNGRSRPQQSNPRSRSNSAGMPRAGVATARRCLHARPPCTHTHMRCHALVGTRRRSGLL
jgi:hypothetical protein